MNSVSPNILIEADKKNILRGALALLLLGLLLLFFLIFNVQNDVLEYFIVIPVIYITTGGLGLLSITRSIPFAMKIYKMIIFSLCFLNAAVSIIGTIFDIYFISKFKRCDPKKNDDCGFQDGIAIFVFILIGLTVIISGAAAVIMIVLIKQISRYEKDRETYELPVYRSL